MSELNEVREPESLSEAIKIGYDMRIIANIDYWSVYPNNLTLNGLNLAFVWDY